MEQLNSLEITILKILEPRQGKENAISRVSLVEAINCNRPLFPIGERDIRSTIKHLVTQHGERIGSCHRGYFMVETSDELEGVCKYYHGYALSSLFVEAKLRRKSLAEMLGQLSLEIAPVE